MPIGNTACSSAAALYRDWPKEAAMVTPVPSSMVVYSLLKLDTSVGPCKLGTNQGIIKYAQFSVLLLNFPLSFFSGGSPVSIKWLSTVLYGNFSFSFTVLSYRDNY